MHPPSAEMHALSLHDALPIWGEGSGVRGDVLRLAANPRTEKEARELLAVLLTLALQGPDVQLPGAFVPPGRKEADRKSTRLNSSHLGISYAVFCLKKKNNRRTTRLNSSHLGISYAVFCLKKKTTEPTCQTK